MNAFVRTITQLTRAISKSTRRNHIKKNLLKMKGIDTTGKDEHTFMLNDAIDLINSAPPKKPTDIVKASFFLNINSKNNDQHVRVVLSYPHSFELVKPSTIVFTNKENHELVTKYGFEIGDQQKFEKLLNQKEVPWKYILSTTDVYAPFMENAKNLGVKKFMPNKKSKTLVEPNLLEDLLKELCKGIYEVNNDSNKTINTMFGRRTLNSEQLVENFRYLSDMVVARKSKSIKGALIKSVYISNKSGRSYKLNPKVYTAGSIGYMK